MALTIRKGIDGCVVVAVPWPNKSICLMSSVRIPHSHKRKIVIKKGSRGVAKVVSVSALYFDDQESAVYNYSVKCLK